MADVLKVGAAGEDGDQTFDQLRLEGVFPPPLGNRDTCQGLH